MDVGLQMICATYGWDNCSDQQAYDEELKLALLAADLGFNCLWAVEHHHHDYSFCPDNLQLMAYLAGQRPNVDVGTAAVILPWNDPLRVAEKVSMLDHFTEGRLRFGVGRGLARREFEAFRVSMDESRTRFDESAAMIVDALETGWMEGKGPHYKQPRVEIRPRPRFPIRDRLYAVASSDDSVVSAAKLGAHMVMFADRPWPSRLPAIQKHRELIPEYFPGMRPPRPLIADFCVCTPTMDGAEELARKYMGPFVLSNFEHYELLGEHFSTVKGYDAYAAKVKVAKEVGIEGIIDGFMQASVWGTPDQVLKMLEERRDLIGDFELATSFRFGGTPYEVAEQSLKLYAKEVLPVVQSWQANSAKVAAE